MTEYAGDFFNPMGGLFVYYNKHSQELVTSDTMKPTLLGKGYRQALAVQVARKTPGASSEIVFGRRTFGEEKASNLVLKGIIPNNAGESWRDDRNKNYTGFTVFFSDPVTDDRKAYKLTGIVTEPMAGTSECRETVTLPKAVKYRHMSKQIKKIEQDDLAGSHRPAKRSQNRNMRPELSEA